MLVGQIEGKERPKDLMRIIFNSAENKLIGSIKSVCFLTKQKKEVINGDKRNKKVKDDCGVNDFTPE